MKVALASILAPTLLIGCTQDRVVSGGPYLPARRAQTGAAATDLPTYALAFHNRIRAEVGAPPLRWSPILAAAADGYAAQLAATGRFEHSNRQSRRGQGENLWTGTRGAYTLDFMLRSWADERRYFRAGAFPNVTTGVPWQDVAHYTQMIWRGTTEVGCALRTGSGQDFLVCRYAPAGNIDRQVVP